MSPPIVVVPCYNEAARLDADAFVAFLDGPGAGFRLLFVDDGSLDGTAGVLAGIAARSPRASVLSLSPNRGKAEAVRQGFLAALEEGPEWVAFLDADLATPLEALPLFEEALRTGPEVEVVLGSRVRLLGRTIERNPLRHCLGRVFATLTSLMLNLPVYDTQCGAKAFRSNSTLARILERPFATRWIFDVEILLRLLQEYRSEDPEREVRALLEMPVPRWRDVQGSKVRPADFLRAGAELARLFVQSRRPLPPPPLEP